MVVTSVLLDGSDAAYVATHNPDQLIRLRAGTPPETVVTRELLPDGFTITGMGTLERDIYLLDRRQGDAISIKPTGATRRLFRGMLVGDPPATAPTGPIAILADGSSLIRQLVPAARLASGESTHTPLLRAHPGSFPEVLDRLYLGPPSLAFSDTVGRVLTRPQPYWDGDLFDVSVDGRWVVVVRSQLSRAQVTLRLFRIGASGPDATAEQLLIGPSDQGRLLEPDEIDP